ncbi:DUF4230 domain-containing protein [Sphingobium chlorophenolicum]|uniref:DUF4230 domain-containing protein n=1 Tax=Sphingobium chlorophenolicum TaxID=46429 RepID=A0A081R9A0_SPHCR|nr:DUF4230 domain-containing protein [Sphingobium chlorophenolicum]KEQ51773.1 putative uncharacterized protein precursor [Sphingobium chlorophenolicum]
MAIALKRFAGPILAGLALLAVGAAMLIGWHRYDRDYAVSVEDDGTAVTKVIAQRFAGASSLKVSELSGTIQSTAQDVRGFGWLKSDQVVKMPFSVDYFIDVSGISASDLEWNEKTRTLIVNAPDVKPGRPNIDESRRTLVQTNGIIVTRSAGEELSRRTSVHAQGRAEKEARSPERMAQARDYGRAALGKLLGAPLSALGYGDARVIVTFPPERADANRERWDVTTPINEVLANKRRSG